MVSATYFHTNRTRIFLLFPVIPCRHSNCNCPTSTSSSLLHFFTPCTHPNCTCPTSTSSYLLCYLHTHAHLYTTHHTPHTPHTHTHIAGTLFRFPLRGPAAAERTDIKPGAPAVTAHDVAGLLASFAQHLPQVRCTK